MKFSESIPEIHIWKKVNCLLECKLKEHHNVKSFFFLFFSFFCWTLGLFIMLLWVFFLFRCISISIKYINTMEGILC